jgi:hypothetical protein
LVVEGDDVVMLVAVNRSGILRSDSVLVVGRENRADFYLLLDFETLRAQLTRAVYRIQTCALF